MYPCICGTSQSFRSFWLFRSGVPYLIGSLEWSVNICMEIFSHFRPFHPFLRSKHYSETESTLPTWKLGFNNLRSFVDVLKGRRHPVQVVATAGSKKRGEEEEGDPGGIRGRWSGEVSLSKTQKPHLVRCGTKFKWFFKTMLNIWPGNWFTHHFYSILNGSRETQLQFSVFALPTTTMAKMIGEKTPEHWGFMTL